MPMRSTVEYNAVEPHGGELIDRRAPKGERAERLQRAEELPKVVLGPRALSDLEMISTGVFSPLTGFMGREDYESVVESMHLSNGLVWSLPIALSANDEEASAIDEGGEISLTNEEGRVIATMDVADRYTYNKSHEAKVVYRTDDENHPGVAALYRQGNTLIGGEGKTTGEEANTPPLPP